MLILLGTECGDAALVEPNLEAAYHQGGGQEDLDGEESDDDIIDTESMISIERATFKEQFHKNIKML
jgi:hypothetical protein